MSNILDTIIVTFGEDVSDEDAANFWSAISLDDTLNTDSITGEAKTSFSPGDLVNILFQMKSGWRITSIDKTSGDLFVNGTVSRTEEQRIFVVDTEREYSLSFQPSGGFSYSWFGKTTTLSHLEERKAKASSAPAIGDVSYGFRATSMTINTPSIELAEGENWPIGVVITVETT